MKRALLAPLAAAGIVMIATGLSFAQGQAPTPNEHPANTTQQNSNSGTRPENMGKSGWTGGRQDTTPSSETTGTGGAPEAHTPGNINNDSVYSTGTDLKGPPAKFPAPKTPE